MDSCSNDEAPLTTVRCGSTRLDQAAAALAGLCDDFGELEALAHMLHTFPASYGLSARLVARLGAVSSRLWLAHDEAVE